MKRNVIITNKNGKYELTDELANDLRLKKISKLHGIISQYSYQKENIVNTGSKLLKTRYWTFPQLHLRLGLVSIRNATLGWNELKESIHYHRF